MLLLFLTTILPFINAECPFTSSSDVTVPNDHHHLRVLRSSGEKGQKTFRGCDCSSTCVSFKLNHIYTHTHTHTPSQGASITDEYKCDWCRTSDSCGHASLAGYWDYCLYESIDKTYVLSYLFNSLSLSLSHSHTHTAITRNRIKKRWKYCGTRSRKTQHVYLNIQIR